MTPEQATVTAILDHIEEWLDEAGCPLTVDQAAQFATARRHLEAAA